MNNVTWEEARAKLAPDHAVVLWKPGCSYCIDLKVDFEDDERFSWVNIAEDEGGAEAARNLNNGNELTPTVLIGDKGFSNPSSSQVRAELG